MKKEHWLWYLSGFAWAIAGSVLAAFSAKSAVCRALMILGSIAVSMVMAFHIPKGMFRGVRQSGVPAKIGMGLFILMTLASLISVGWVILYFGIMQQNGQINCFGIMP